MGNMFSFFNAFVFCSVGCIRYKNDLVNIAQVNVFGLFRTFSGPTNSIFFAYLRSTIKNTLEKC